MSNAWSDMKFDAGIQCCGKDYQIDSYVVNTRLNYTDLLFFSDCENHFNP